MVKTRKWGWLKGEDIDDTIIEGCIRICGIKRTGVHFLRIPFTIVPSLRRGVILLRPILSIFLVGTFSSCVNKNDANSLNKNDVKASPDHRVALIGHLYSSYVHSQTTVGVHQVERRDTLETLAQDFVDRGTEAAFFLGDITTDSREDEWQMLEDIFGKVATVRHYIPGNHDYHARENFYKFGGKGNTSTVIGNCKFLMLDVKNWFEASDLDFIKTELADSDKYDHVFILMHYLLRGYNREPKPGEDLNKPYNGVSNWNKEVVPLIRGKVATVFCGDLRRPEGAITAGSNDENGILYIMNSFLFAGEGPLIYLELEISGKELAILPRAVPIDLRHKWYDPASKAPPKP